MTLTTKNTKGLIENNRVADKPRVYTEKDIREAFWAGVEAEACGCPKNTQELNFIIFLEKYK